MIDFRPKSYRSALEDRDYKVLSSSKSTPSISQSVPMSENSKMITLPLLIIGGSGLLITWIGIMKRRRDEAYKMCGYTKNLKGKVALITGGSGGLGLETAVHLAEQGASIVLASTSERKLDAAVQHIKSRITEDTIPPLHSMPLDLSSLHDVQKFADAFTKKFDRLDILLNNGGIMGCPFALSKDGIELHFAVNHLGHFHLTNLLMDLIKRTKGSRIVNVTSGFYKKMKYPVFENLKEQTPDYDPLRVGYARSKLANCLHVVKLAQMLDSYDTSAYAVRPGFVRGTDLGRHFSGVFKILKFLATPLAWYFSKSPLQGVQPILHCCVSPQTELKSGKLYDNCDMEEYFHTLVNDQAADELWRVSEDLVAEAMNKSD